MLTVRKGCWKGRLFLPTSSLPALPFSPGGETYRRKLRHQETRCELELVEEIYYGQPSTLSLNHTFFLSLLLFSAPIHEEDEILYRRAYHHDLNVCGTPLSFRLFAIPIRENHGRDMDRRNEMRKRAKFLDKRFNLLECNADTSLYNLKIKPCVTTLDAIIFVKKVTHRSKIWIATVSRVISTLSSVVSTRGFYPELSRTRFEEQRATERIESRLRALMVRVIREPYIKIFIARERY